MYIAETQIDRPLIIDEMKITLLHGMNKQTRTMWCEN